MRRFFSCAPHNLASNIVLWSSAVSILLSQECYAQTNFSTRLASFFGGSEPKEEAYTVNFNNTSVIEVIRFISKITGTNFVFSENDLQFTVTIISEEPISAKNITSALIQVLRVNGLKLLEQEGNFLITPIAANVNQIPAIVPADAVDPSPIKAPVVTRVFRIKNANIKTLASIIKPMTSDSSLIDVSTETSQLIITDITTNIDKIATLLLILDTPHSKLEIESYTSKHVNIGEIISLTEQILFPFKENNPLLFIPHADNNAIFIVSTPYLIEKALSVMEDLDIPPSIERVGTPPLPPLPQTAYVYKVTQISTTALLQSLMSIAKNLSKDSSARLVQAIHSAKALPDEESILVVTDTGTWDQLKDLLTRIDTPPNFGFEGKPALWIYRVQNMPANTLKTILKEASSKSHDEHLKNTIADSKSIAETESLVFSGPQAVLDKIKEMLPGLDVMTQPAAVKSELFLYQIHHSTAAQISQSLQHIAKSFQDKELSSAIQGHKWIQESNSLLFNATQEVIVKLKNLLPSLDSAGLNTHFFLYKIQYSSPSQLRAALQAMSGTIKDKELLETIRTLKPIDDNKTLLFSGNDLTLKKLEDILATLDLPQNPVYTYQILVTPFAQLQSNLLTLAKQMQDEDFTYAVQNMQWIEQSNTILFKAAPATLSKIEQLLPKLDVKLTIYTYQVQKSSGPELIAALKQIGTASQDPDLLKAVESAQWIAENGSLLFHGTPDAITRIQTLLPSLDSQESRQKTLLYKIQNASAEQIQNALKTVAEHIKDQTLLTAVQDSKWIAESNSILFKGTPSTLSQIENLLPDFDIQLQLYTYKVRYIAPEYISTILMQMESSVQEKDLIAAIQSAKWIDESHSLLFYGTPRAIAKLTELLPSFDSQILEEKTKTNFFMYQPKNQTGEDLKKNILELSENLKQSGLQNTQLLAALNSIKWVAASNSLVFTGDSASLERIQAILQNLDAPSKTSAPFQVFLYKPLYASQNQLQDALTRFAETLNPSLQSDQSLAQAIYRAQWVPENTSFLFKADADTIGRLKGVLSSVDNPKELAGSYPNSFFLYKLQKASGELVIRNLKNLSDNLPPDDPNTVMIVKALQTLKWVRENNSILITGSTYAIEQVKTLIAEFDIASDKHSALTDLKGDFFIYKPLHKTTEETKSALFRLADDLQSADFSNQSLVETLRSVKTIPETNSLLFTGTAESLSRVRSILPSIDNLSNDRPIEQANFFVYKIKKTPYTELITSIKTFAAQLGSADLPDKDLERSLNSVQWIKETNSLLFTGLPSTLQKLEAIVEKFDIGSQQPAQPRHESATFVVYTPKSQKGSSLIALMHEFAQSLSHSMVSDPELFDAINHLKYIEKTNALLVSGTPSAIQKIQDLLARFDVPADEADELLAATESANFLIYKLQYHSGIEIQNALKKVASSLIKTAPDANKALTDAVDSLQWVEITNSLLATGTPDILAKLKGLIANLDVPLRQVFIEVLVVETTLFNTQNFGLQWGTQMQYLNKTIGAMGNFPAVVNNFSSGNTTPSGNIDLSNPISFTTNLNPPVQGNANALNSTAVPFSTGFDLGVIGDIIFHKGASFISLGSLVNALQVDSDSTVLMNPKIITQDGHTSNIFVGQNIPFVGSFVSNTASNTVQSSNIEYRDVGVNLTITPTLGNNNVVTLEIKQDISEQTNNTTQIQGAQVTGIQTSHTTMNTRVHVPDRHFLVLSGMIQDTKIHYRTSIPCLGGLPVIGALFAENDRADTKSNVIIFLRPFIIDTVDDFERITAAEEDLYKQQAGPQDLKEELDAGLEMIKNLNNE